MEIKKCNSCGDINFKDTLSYEQAINSMTYADVLSSTYLDFYYEEVEGQKDMQLVIKCFKCGTTKKANGEVIYDGIKLTKKEIDKQINDIKVISTTTWDFTKKEVRDKWRRENPELYNGNNNTSDVEEDDGEE